MLTNILLTSALIVVAILFSVFGYDYYYSLSQAKQIQQTYDTISEIKKILAKQYNKNPDDITRDEIIAILPKGKNWEKLFLSNQNNGNTINNSAIIDENVNFVLSSDDKLKLLALKSRLNNLSDLTTATNDTTNNTIKFPVSNEDKTRLDSANLIKKELTILKEIIYINIDSMTTQQSVDDIITNNSSSNLDIMKSSLKNDLSRSKNSTDLVIYNKIKAYL